jgi:hypothetical protein
MNLKGLTEEQQKELEKLEVRINGKPETFSEMKPSGGFSMYTLRKEKIVSFEAHAANIAHGRLNKCCKQIQGEGGSQTFYQLMTQHHFLLWWSLWSSCDVYLLLPKGEWGLKHYNICSIAHCSLL